jgi:methionyl-tRNA formyltransferase
LRFPHGAINVHFSLLPKYRGAAPVNWAIANGETKTGVTTMKMDAGLDTGDILLQNETDIGPVKRSELMERLSFSGARTFIGNAFKFQVRSFSRKQDDANATFAPILKRDDGLIDWELSASEINNRIRGFPAVSVVVHAL